MGIAALVVGLFYTCAGFNKFFDDRRRGQMRRMMTNLFGWNNENFMWLAISASELLFGIGAILGSVLAVPYLLVLSVTVLFCISVAAFGMVTYGQMMEQWKPTNVLDHVSTWLYMPEVLLALLCVIALI